MHLQFRYLLFSPGFFFQLLIFGGVTALGCGSDTKPHVKVKSAQTVVEKPFQENKQYIPAMYLKRAEFLALPTVKTKDKLILQLSTPTDSSHFLLAIHLADKAGGAVANAKSLYLKPFANELNQPMAVNCFAEHHTKESDYQDLRSEVEKYDLVKYILFEPTIDSNKHFCYRISGVEKLPVDLMAHGFATKSIYSHPSDHVWK